MKNKLLLVLLLSLTCYEFSYSQVGIGTTAPAGALEIKSSTNGLLIPNVSLSSRIVSAPVVNPNGGGVPLAGTMVWNTATAGTAPNDVSPGFYYWNSGKWYRKTDLVINNYVYPPTNINANTVYTLTGTIPGHDSYDGVTVAVAGDWVATPNVTIEYVESRAGSVRFKVRNNTASTNYTGMDFVITTFKY